MDVFSIAAGAAGVGIVYFLYLIATKGLPAALAWAKAKWNAGKAGVSALQGDVESLVGKVSTLERELGGRLANVEASLVSIKQAPVPAEAPPAAAPFASKPVV